jgi:hypothetical protein
MKPWMSTVSYARCSDANGVIYLADDVLLDQSALLSLTLEDGCSVARRVLQLMGARDAGDSQLVTGSRENGARRVL